jgi:amino acid adenylation domain-containing protein
MKSSLSNEPNSVSVITRLLESVSVHKKHQVANLKSLSIPELVSAHAADDPDAPALAMDAQILTYGELESQSNRLARLLLSIGAEREVIVGLYLERSPALAVGALGILKAGAAYLPLDPSYPPERMSLILKDAQAPIVVTTSKLMPRLPEASWKVVDLADPRAILARYSPHPLRGKVRPEQLAYVIYTSGSAGRPKGVQIVHSNLLNLVHWHLNAFHVSPLDRATLLASPGFDASVWELWPYLCAGASLHVPDDATRVSPASLRNWMVCKRITISFAPTPLAEKLMFLKWPADTALRTLLTGADVLHHYPDAELPFTVINNYGPTECTVVATSGVVPPNGCTTTLPSIGRAIANTETYILDDQLTAVNAGEPGELYIGGPGVGRGYLSDPELTSQKFIPNPFSEDPNARLYKTGDLVRTAPDGNIQFCGRMDEQTKIRGYRVEPNEISVVLCSHPAVESGIVIARKDHSGNNFLAAYVIPKKDRQIKASDLRSHLQARLPDYMVPINFVALDSFPLTTNGKIDRSALPAPSLPNALEDPECSLADTHVNQKLVAIISSLLGVKRVAPHDNFFLLGGHSLLGAQVIAQIREVFSVELSVRTLFDNPTVAGLSDQIHRALASTQPATQLSPEYDE